MMASCTPRVVRAAMQTCWLRLFLKLAAGIAVSTQALAATLSCPETFPTIQSAINASVPGDTILIEPGVYNEILTTQAKAITLIGRLGPSVTIVDGGQQGSVLRLDGGGLVRGLTLQNGHGDDGGGLLISGPGATHIEQCTISGNVAGSFDHGTGGGVCIFATGGIVELIDNLIVNNVAGDEGGGIYERAATSPVIIDGNRIVNNVCHVGGGGVSQSTASTINNLIDGNSSDHFAGGVLCRGGAVHNNTVVRNNAQNSVVSGAGIFVTGGAAHNNIVAFNLGPGSQQACGGIFVSGEDGFPPSVFCNDSWGNDGSQYQFAGVSDTRGGPNISADPQFCDAPSGKFNLSTGSPCASVRNTECGLIGAYDVDDECQSVHVRKLSWGMLKQIYR